MDEEKTIPLKELTREAQNAIKSLSDSYDKMMQVGKGTLGWDGSAKMMCELGLDGMLGLTPRRTSRVRSRRVKVLTGMLQQAFFEDLWEKKEKAREIALPEVQKLVGEK